MATDLIINEVFDPHLNLEKEDFPDLCRVCMSKNKNMKSLFNSQLSKTADEFEFCTGILISEDDGLPTLMCDMCLHNLSVAHKFKNTCLCADKILKKILSEQVLLNSTESVKKEVIEEIEDLHELDDINCQSQDLVIKSETTEINLNNTIDDCNDLEIKSSRKLRSATKPQKKQEMKEQKLEVKKKHICKVCGQKYLSRPLLMKHKLKVHGWKSKNKPSQTKSKKVALKKRKEKRENLKEIIEQDNKKNQTHVCNVCQLNFQSKNSMLKHKLIEHNQEWICEVCGKLFAYLSSLRSHVRCHGPPSFCCSYCDYIAWHKSDLTKHLRTHTGEKNYVCEYCTHSFHTISNMYDHIRRQHEGNTRVHKCPRCGRAFSAKDKLMRHIDTHDNIKRHECYECHARFSRRCHWKEHLQKQHSIIVPRLRPGRHRPVGTNSL